MTRGVNIIGMPFGMHGLGQVMRDRIKALQAADIPVCVIEQVYSSLSSKVAAPWITPLLSDTAKYDTNLVCHNLPATRLLHRDRPELFEGRYTIGAPFWEFPQLPDHHAAAFAYLDEVWTPGKFLERVFSQHTDVPVHTMPLHIDLSEAAQDTPEATTRPREADIVFGYSFDCNSMMERKDPKALLLAFLEAFSAQPKTNVRLVIKYKHEPSPIVSERALAEIKALAGLDPRIELIEGAFTAAQMTALFDRFDVYVSPHRAEGTGLGMIEAMLKGKAVAANPYSGCEDFVLDDHAVPIASYACAVGAAAFGDIRPDFTWSEVRMESLIAALHRFAGAPEEARSLGARSRAFIQAHHGHHHHGAACKVRLQNLGAL